MTTHEFAWYLVGLRDALPKGEPPSAEQWAAIQTALGTVFSKETPNRFEEPAPKRVRVDFAFPPKWDIQGGIPVMLSTNQTC